ncbi:hypothetical protein C8R43DRAFT_1090765 [Mycena crocata]|nr:hypothetical protein C8R43DRAFT_1090765 [Mycena crocata]
MAETSSSVNLALLAPGGMGSAIASRLSFFGAGTILTNLDGRSNATIQRAHASNMQHASYAEIVERATCIYSIVPPKDAFGLAETILGAYRAAGSQRKLIFVDCNAVNPDSAKRMAALFHGTGITFLDGVIIGTPPTESFNPGIYVAADPEDLDTLDEFAAMSIKYGLNVLPLKGKGAGIGDASALKMAHAGIVKAADASSPSTADGLLHALNLSQPTFVDLIIRLLPAAIPKAYRFVGEMEEVGGFVLEEGRPTFEGLATTFARLAAAHENNTSDAEGHEVQLLLEFVEKARRSREPCAFHPRVCINIARH